MVHKSAFIRAAISAWCIELEARYNGGKQWPAVPSGQPEPPLGQLAADADTVHSTDEPPSQLGLSFDDAGTGLDERLSAFIDTPIASGRYRSADEVVSAALRMLEDRETEMHALRQHVDISGGLTPQGRQAALALRALMVNDPDGPVHETTVNAMWAARHDPPGA
ncbi:type II toxin-antitoxin system ParD family antitoxin [Nocardia puris]|nr:type II toxin-antitoxin system ParD family antitoxin [Nocardia puris]